MGLINCLYLVADCLVDEADEAHVSDMPGKADVVGVEIEIARSLFKRSPKTSWGIEKYKIPSCEQFLSHSIEILCRNPHKYARGQENVGSLAKATMSHTTRGEDERWARR